MKPRVAVLGLLGGLLGGLLAGCAPSAEDDEPRTAAALVQEAQQRVRFWGTGHVTVHQVARPVSRDLGAVWRSDYDLGRRRWDATLVAADGRVRNHWVGTTDRVYLTSPDRRGAELGMWTELEAGSGGTQPHLDAVLSFEAGQVLRREADGWSVAGTVPVPVALVAAGVGGSATGDRDQIVEAEGTAPAVLLIGRDHEVRELRLRGAAFDVTSPLTDDVRSRLHDATTSIVLTELGEHVQVDLPPETAKILKPIPTATKVPPSVPAAAPEVPAVTSPSRAKTSG
jgi:hypothetical protein